MGSGQQKGSASEVTAIPALLGLLELRGCIVTLDAMGCQREIAEQIREQGADYVLAVKANQKELHEAIEDYLETAQQAGYRAVPLERLAEVDSGHGRVEVRRYEKVGRLAEAVRGHWSIENSLHWVLDVTFREDDSRLRSGYGAENFAVIRHIALNLLKREPSNGSLRQKRYKAALSNEFRSNVCFPQENYALALRSASARKAANRGSCYPAKFESE
jgi:predicted transposase YbfD/YdcC